MKYFSAKIPRRFLFCFSALLILAGLLFVSCGKSQPEAAKEETPPEEEAAPAAAETGVVLVRAGLWEAQSDGKLKWARYINAGETLEWKNERAKFVNTANNQENEYWHVFSSGDCWIRDYAAAGPAKPAVVVKPDAVLYSRPDLGSITTGRNKTIRQWSIAAVHEESEGFSRISAYYASAGQYYVFNNVWIKTENLSMDGADVRGISLYQLALDAEDLVVRRELLNNALSVSRRFEDLVGREFAEMEFAGQIESIKPLVLKVTEDELVVFDRPDTGTGIAVGRILSGETVRAIAKTKELIKNAGTTRAYWYKIDNPRGWVFGAYLKGEEKNKESGD